MSETPEPSSLSDMRTFLWGLVWTCAGGLAPAAMTLWYDLTKYKAYGIDWPNVWMMALSGAAPLAVAYWRKHRALIHLPRGVRERLAWAEKASLELDDARTNTAQLKVVAEAVTSGVAEPEMLSKAVLAMPEPVHAVTTDSEMARVSP